MSVEKKVRWGSPANTMEKHFIQKQWRKKGVEKG